MNVYAVKARPSGWSLAFPDVQYIVAMSYADVEAAVPGTIYQIQLLGEVKFANQKEKP